MTRAEEQRLLEATDSTIAGLSVQACHYSGIECGDIRQELTVGEASKPCCQDTVSFLSPSKVFSIGLTTFASSSPSVSSQSNDILSFLLP